MTERNLTGTLASSEAKETERRYEKVVFGDWAHAVDRDQAVGFYLAVKGGLVSRDVEVSFEPKVGEEALKNGKVLVLEGVPDEAVRNNGESGNFENNPKDDTPAATMLYRQHRADMQRNGFNDQAVGITRYLTAAETHKEVPADLKGLRKGDLQAATTHVLAGLKLEFAGNPRLLLQKFVEVMDATVDPQRQQPIEELYREYHSAGQRYASEAVRALQDKAEQHPESFHLTETATGKRLAYFDTRGLDVQLGGNKVVEDLLAVRGTEADLVMLVADAKDDAGQIIGVKYSIGIPKEVAGEDLRVALRDRIQYQEDLFGKGRVAEFGGHERVLGSDKAEGSGLDPDKLWIAMQEFYEHPRYAEAEFGEVARDFASELLGSEHVHVAGMTAGSEYVLPERVFEVGVEAGGSGGRTAITFKESEIGLYEEFFEHTMQGSASEKQAAMQRMLREKTILTEPAAIADYRANKARTELYRLVDSDEPVKLLNVLDDLNPAQIEALPSDMQLAILEKIASSGEAIDLVYNKDNLRYQITQNQLPDWLRGDVEKYKAGRYAYLSVPYKVDEYLVKAAHEAVLKEGSPEMVQRLGKTMVTILGSEAYKASHQGAIYDQLLHSTLRLCADSKLNQKAETKTAAMGVVADLRASYGEGMDAHWRRLVTSDRTLVVRAAQLHPQVREVADALGLDIDAEVDPKYHLELWSPVHLDTPKAEVVQANVEAQRARGQEPYVNVFYQVGRDVRGMVNREGVVRESGEVEKDLVYAADLSVEGFLRLGGAHREEVQIAEVLYHMVDEIDQMLGEDPEAKIRVITGGLPGISARESVNGFVKAFMDGKLDMERFRRIHERLVFTDFNMQDRKFYDRKLREGK